jgi:hypothetical protein
LGSFFGSITELGQFNYFATKEYQRIFCLHLFSLLTDPQGVWIDVAGVGVPGSLG